MKLHLEAEQIKKLNSNMLKHMADTEKVSKENGYEAEMYYFGKKERPTGKDAQYYVIVEKRKYKGINYGVYGVGDCRYYAGLYADDKPEMVRCVYSSFDEKYMKEMLPGIIKHNQKLLKNSKTNKDIDRYF